MCDIWAHAKFVEVKIQEPDFFKISLHILKLLLSALIYIRPCGSLILQMWHSNNNMKGSVEKGVVNPHFELYHAVKLKMLIKVH